MPPTLKTRAAWLLTSLPQIVLLQIGFLQAALAPAAHAAGPALRIASAFDPQTLDPHAVALLYHTRVTYQVYDSLVNRDQAFKIEPALALSWLNTSPTSWRFKLRQIGRASCRERVLASV